VVIVEPGEKNRKSTNSMARETKDGVAFVRVTEEYADSESGIHMDRLVVPGSDRGALLDRIDSALGKWLGSFPRDVDDDLANVRSILCRMATALRERRASLTDGQRSRLAGTLMLYALWLVNPNPSDWGRHLAFLENLLRNEIVSKVADLHSVSTRRALRKRSSPKRKRPALPRCLTGACEPLHRAGQDCSKVPSLN
jgi:hypothetical protein